MTQEQIFNEVANSNWQPTFTGTFSLDEAVDSILKPHEDYFLGLHDKVKEIIEREIHYAKTISDYRITFADICNWQKELFEHKIEIIDRNIRNINPDEDWFFGRDSTKIYIDLPNQYINLGLRKTSVKVGNWRPPHPIILDELKEMCFPISVNLNEDRLSFFIHGWVGAKRDTKKQLLSCLTEWFKIFQTIHFLEDLNGRVGGIVINILYHLLTGEYLINSEYDAGGH